MESIETGVQFLWVARGGETKLKEAFEGSYGIVMSWCDQLRVMCHIQRCGYGFNSTLEGSILFELIFSNMAKINSY